MFADSDGLVGKPVAVYGLSGGRKEENANIIASRDIPITIDQLNRNLGITEGSYGIDNIPQIMEDIYSGSRVAGASTIEGRIPKNEGNAGRLGVEVEVVLTIKWAKFLLQNIEKINVNRRITDKRSEHRSLREWIAGDAKKIHQYAHKNLAHNYRKSHDTKYYDNLFEKASKGVSLDGDASFLLDRIATIDFFRQTSKLGIDFFIKEKIPIHFTHSIGPNMGCFTHDEAMMKPYKKLNERQDADGDPTAYAEPVTFSEHRHATKRNSSLVTPIK